jgi:hypothetical protein
MSDIFEDFRKAHELVMSFKRDWLPMPWRIMASHSVPYGRVYRQWDAKGRLLLWVNRGAIHDLPALKFSAKFDYSDFTGYVPISIPVFFE